MGDSPKIKKVHFFNAAPNFGDLLNIEIFRRLGAEEIENASPSQCSCVAIGSLLENFLTSRKHWVKVLKGRLCPPAIVYGTGFIAPPKKNKIFFRRLDVRVVRGYKTLERLQKSSGVKIAENIAIADPGLLASRLFDTRNIPKKYKLGIIPHYADKGSPLLEKIAMPDSAILDISAPPEIFMRRIAECETVVSSAMHGLIAADSLGIPNMRIILGDKIVGGDYKFDDYYSVYGITGHRRINLNTETITEDGLYRIRKEYPISAMQIAKLQDRLLKAFHASFQTTP